MQAILKYINKTITSCDIDEKVKYSLNLVMQYFQNTIKNLSIFGQKLVLERLLLHFYTSYLYLNSCNQAPLVYYKGSVLN